MVGGEEAVEIADFTRLPTRCRIPKGGFDDIRARGLPALRDEIARLAPHFRDRLGALSEWSAACAPSTSPPR